MAGSESVVPIREAFPPPARNKEKSSVTSLKSADERKGRGVDARAEHGTLPRHFMTSNPLHRHITARDQEILAALFKCPLTVEQLRKASNTFVLPFQSPRRVRRRLHVLVAMGHTQRFRYATSSEGSSPYYYKLTLAGLRLLLGKDAKPPTTGFLKEISIGHHEHTQHLADFIVHTLVAAKTRSVALTDLCGENTVRLEVGGENLFPDCCFRLVDPKGQPWNFVVELDCSTETVRSAKNLESWQRKVRLYEQFQDSRQSRFRVLVLTTKSRQRRDHILRVASEEAKNRGRLIFYGAYLPDYLAAIDPISGTCFLDHNAAPVALVPGFAAAPDQHGAASPLSRTPLVPAVALATAPALR